MVIKKCTGGGIIQSSYSVLPIQFRTYSLACKGRNAPSSRHNQHTSPHWQVVIAAFRLSMHVVKACLILRCYWADKNFIYKACYLLNAAALKASTKPGMNSMGWTKSQGQTC